MYTIYHNGQLMYDPRFQEYGLIAPTITLTANKFGTLDFTIPPGHPAYSSLSKISSVLTVYKDGDLFFQCRPAYSKRGFKNSVTFKCEDLLARLNDFCVRPFDFTGTITAFVDFVLEAYNDRVGADKKILRGNIYVTDPNNYIHYSSVDYLPCWDVLQSRLVETHGGYFVPRYIGDGTMYLDYLRDEDLATSTQAIRFGENLTDLFIATDSYDTFSVLVPVGADIETYDEHGDLTTERLTIKSVNDGKDYLESQTGIALYGRRETTKRWEDVTIAANLLTKGQQWLQENAVKFNEEVSVSAIDLHNADVDIATFNWLTWIPVSSSVHGISTQYIAESLTIPLGDPSSSKLQLGGVKRTLTDRILDSVNSATQAEIQTAVNKLHDITEMDFEEIRNTITEQEANLRATIGTTETNILLQVMEEYVGRSEYAEYQQQIGTEISQTKENITLTAQNLETYVDSSTADVKEYVNGVQTYMRYSTAGLELGAVNSPFMTRITNTKISFLQNGYEIAYISNRKLYITEAQVTDRILFGQTNQSLFAWVTTNTGIALKWVGEIPASGA